MLDILTENGYSRIMQSRITKFLRFIYLVKPFSFKTEILKKNMKKNLQLKLIQLMATWCDLIFLKQLKTHIIPIKQHVTQDEQILSFLYQFV